MNKRKLVLIDGNALVHRAFHALPPTMTDSAGRMVNAVYGFTLVFLRVLTEFKPDFVVATFDRKGKTFRHRQYKLYKAQRKKAPDELYAQIPLVWEVLKAFGVPIHSQKGLEADDLIGAIAQEFVQKENGEVVIVTGDSDTLQLVTPKIKVFALRKGTKDIVLYGEEEVQAKMGLGPSLIVDWKALAGDASDNIPGAKGIGPKTAVDLLSRFGSLESIYTNLESLPAPMIKKLTESKEAVFLSRSLAKIKTDFKTGLSLTRARFGGIEKNRAAILEVFNRMAFVSLIKRLGLAEGEELKEMTAQKKGDMTKKRLTKEQSAGVLPENQLEWRLQEVNNAEEEKIFSSVFKKAKQGIFLSYPRPGLEKTKWEFDILAGEAIFWAPVAPSLSLVFKVNKETFIKIFSKKGHTQKGLIGFETKTDFKQITEGETVYTSLNDDVKMMAYLVSAGRGGVDLLSIGKREKVTLPFWQEAIKSKPIKRQAALFDSGPEEEKERQKKDNALMAELAMAVKTFYPLLLAEQKRVAQEQRTIGVSPKPFFEVKNGFLGLDKVYAEIEMPLVKVLAKMEQRGIVVDVGKNQELKIDYIRRADKLRKKVFVLCGEEFNLDSPQQLSLIFYEKLKFSTKGIKKGKSGFYSTSADALELLAEKYKVAKLVGRYRELTKLINTYLEPLNGWVSPKTGRIHACFNQEITTTGRLSASNPNIQNIPARSVLGRRIRGLFGVESGYRLYSFDYSQIELRLVAHYSGDKTMRRVFLDNGDIHRTTAGEISGVAEKEVTTKMRRAAKELNFGLIYGMGSYGFARAAGIERAVAKEFIDRYHQKFPAVFTYLEKAKQAAREKGYTETIFGRRRYLLEINSWNQQVKASGERMAVNMPLQGTAADILKLALVRIDRFLVRERLEKEIKMLISVHDEILLEIKKGSAEEYVPQIKKIMEEIVELAVPLKVEIKRGENWEEMEPYLIESF